MATTSYDERTSTIIKTKEYTDPAYSHLTKEGLVYVSRESGTDYIRDQRPRPNPLWSAPTARVTVHEFKRTYGDVTRLYSPGSNAEYRTFGTFDAKVPLGPSVVTDWESDLRQEVLGTQANLSSMIAEIHKVNEGFVSFVNGLRKIRRQILSGKFRINPRSKQLERIKGIRYKRQINLNDAASMHLAVHFGIKPLVSDLYGLYHKSIGRPDWAPPVVRVRSRSKAKDSTEKIENPFVTSADWTVTQYASVYIRLNTEGLMAARLGNPVEWLWEATPWSFVVDWALPVGTYLSSLFALQGVNVVSPVSVSTVKEADVTTDYWEGRPSDSIESTSPATGSYKTYSRAVHDSIPYPKFPSFKPSIGLLRAQHATALLASLRHGRKTKAIKRLYE